MTITVYRFEDANGAEQMWTTQNPVEAKEHAEKYGYRCLAMEFEYADEELVWDLLGARALRSTAPLKYSVRIPSRGVRILLVGKDELIREAAHRQKPLGPMPSMQ